MCFVTSACDWITQHLKFDHLICFCSGVKVIEIRKIAKLSLTPPIGFVNTCLFQEECLNEFMFCTIKVHMILRWLLNS